MPARRARRQTSTPSGPGPSATSSRTISCSSVASASSAASPVPATATSWPSASSAPLMASRRSASSSTSRMRGLTPGHRSNEASTEPQCGPSRLLTARRDRGAPMPTPRSPDMRLASLSIVLPCYDEAPNVARAVAEARAAAMRCAERHEIIVVDDGSRDGTRGVADLIAATDPNVRVVVHDANRGYGAAVRSGLMATRAEWVLLTDGDLQFDLAELDALIALTAEHDLICGFRIARADNAARRLAAHAWNAPVERTFGVGVRDVDCAFKLMRGRAVRALRLESDGAMVSTELLVRARAAGWRVTEAGVHHRPRVAGEATGGAPRVVLRAFRERRVLLRALAAEAEDGRARTPSVPRPRVT